VPSADTAAGKLVRLPLRLIPKGSVVPILATAARGKKWIAGSGPHSCWLGFNEHRQRRVFSREVRPGAVVWDVGANVGSYTILASVLVGPHGHVEAFEPVGENVQYLRRHVALNHLVNVTVHETAVYGRSGRVRFASSEDRVLGRIDELAGVLEVEARTVDGLVEEGIAPPPDVMKIDVEGGEVAVLKGALGVLDERGPVIFLSTHGEGLKAECVELLARIGYRVEAIDRAGAELLARPAP